MNPKIKILIVLLVLVFIVHDCECQRGGRSRSRSSSSGSRSRSSYGGRSSYGRSRGFGSYGQSSIKQNCTTVNGTQVCTPMKSQPASWLQIGLMGVIFAVFVGFESFKNFFKNFFDSDSKPNSGFMKPSRQKRVKQSMDDFDRRMQSHINFISEQQRQSILTWFKSRQWTQTAVLNNLKETFYCKMTILNLRKINDYKYEIRMSGNDEVGKSLFEGILIFHQSGIALMLDKMYENKAQAGQQGLWDILLYEGMQEGEQFRGKWAYKGFETIPQNSGTWRMTHN